MTQSNNNMLLIWIHVLCPCLRRVMWHMRTTCGWRARSSASWEPLSSYCWRWISETCFIFLHAVHSAFHCHILLCPLVQQIPDILRVGAKRYFGQTALGGPFHVILWVETFLSSKIKHTVLKYLLTFLVFFDQYQLRLLGGAAVCVQSLWGAGRGRGDGTVFSSGLEQRHVLRSRLSNARPLCHHDTEGRTQLSLDSDTVL